MRGCPVLHGKTPSCKPCLPRDLGAVQLQEPIRCAAFLSYIKKPYFSLLVSEPLCGPAAGAHPVRGFTYHMERPNAISLAPEKLQEPIWSAALHFIQGGPRRYSCFLRRCRTPFGVQLSCIP